MEGEIFLLTYICSRTIILVQMFHNGRKKNCGAAGQADHSDRCGQIRCGLYLQRSGPGGAAGKTGLHGAGGMLPFLLRRRAVCDAAEGADDQRVLLRLSVLREPPLQRRATHGLYAPGAGRAHHRLLPAQLYRGAFPLLCCAERPGLHHRADDRDPAPHPGGVRLCRIHPRKGHPRSGSAAHLSAGTAGGPDEREHRAALRGIPESVGPGQDQGLHPDPHGPDSGGHSRVRAGPQAVPGRSPVRSGRTVHPDDHRRHAGV